MTETELCDFLTANELPYQKYVHPAVFTCEEAEAYKPVSNAVSTKNLFLCDKKSRRFLLFVTSCDKIVNLTLLGEQIGIPRIRFASQDNLEKLIGVKPGSVTMMGLINDLHCQVELYIDQEIWDNEFFQTHPLVNTATLIVSRETLIKFFQLTGHRINVISDR